MQLDTTIEQRLKEFEQVNDEIEQARNDCSKLEEQSQKTQIELLAEKLERGKNVFEILKFQTLSKRYDEVATSKPYDSEGCQTSSEPHSGRSRRSRRSRTHGLRTR